MNRIHPEIRKEMILKYFELSKKYPGAPPTTLWDFTQKYVKAQALADTALFLARYINVKA